MTGKFLEKVLDVIGTGVGMPQFVNGNVMMLRALNLFAGSKKGLTIEKARRTAIGACVGSYIPYETGHPVEGQPNLGKVLELTMNDGFDPRTKQQIGQRREILNPSRTSRSCTPRSRSSSNSARIPCVTTR